MAKNRVVPPTLSASAIHHIAFVGGERPRAKAAFSYLCAARGGAIERKYMNIRQHRPAIQQLTVAMMTHRDIPAACEACPVSILIPCAQTAQHRLYSREKSKKLHAF